MTILSQAEKVLLYCALNVESHFTVSLKKNIQLTNSSSLRRTRKDYICMAPFQHLKALCRADETQAQPALSGDTKYHPPALLFHFSLLVL